MSVTFSKPIIVELPDGTKFHCATPQQAAEMYRLAKPSAPQIPDITLAQVIPPRQRSHSVLEQVKEQLRPYDGKEIGASEMAEALGVESVNGVGTKLRHLRLAFELAGSDLDNWVRQRKLPDGTMRWQIVLSTTGEELAKDLL